MLKYSIFIAFQVCAVYATYSQAKQKFPTPINITMPYGLDDKKSEFSGLASCGDSLILLICQKPAMKGPQMFAIRSADVQRALMASGVGKRKLADKVNVFINNYEKYRTDTVKDFDGIEGAVVVGGHIYFTIETQKNFCYLSKGELTLKDNSIFVDVIKTVSVLKPDNGLPNAGFESIVYIPELESILIIFERNRIKGKKTAFSFTTDLSKKGSLVFSTPLFFRITDAAFDGKTSNQILAINHHFKDKTEIDYYIGSKDELENRAKAKRIIGRVPDSSSFTQIVALTLNKELIMWEVVRAIGTFDDNWEGIMPFMDGVLMISDPPRTDTQGCKLHYYKLVE
ncbi:hypothetical protein HRH25_23580 [Flavisolibacter sp. BT320]|nr:hypothetical protein [Flavisolibacter longurius]